MSAPRSSHRTTNPSPSKETAQMNVPAKPFRRARLLAALTATAALAAAAFAAAPAAATIGTEFGLGNVDVSFENKDGSAATQAGSHPYQVTTSFDVNRESEEFEGFEFETHLYEEIKDVLFELPSGFVGDSKPVPYCPNSIFGRQASVVGECPNNTQVGTSAISFAVEGFLITEADQNVYMLPPPPGKVARVGYKFLGGVPIIIDFGLSDKPPYSLVAGSPDVPQTFSVAGSTLTIWGNPASPDHDAERGLVGGSVETQESAFLTLPRACEGPLEGRWETDSWQNPGVFASGDFTTHDFSEPPEPQGFTGCGKVPFHPELSAQPTSRAAQSPTGLDLSLDFHDEGLSNPDAIAQSDLKKAVVTLPEGFTANPSLAEGLAVCSEADLARETVDSEPGEGCPEASKIGTIEVQSPLIDDPINGALYMAEPYENRFGTLLALYMVIRNPKLGIIIKQAAKIEPDPKTGQLVTTAEDIPQLPFSHFKLHFREGGRSPLISPPTCGTYAAEAEFTPWSGAAPHSVSSVFEIVSGPDNGPCPPGGTPPFHPDFEAGSVNNNAASYSPFDMRLTRGDGEQDMTKLSVTLPPGVVGNLSGVAKCPDTAIAEARAKSGLQERAAPSCPAGSAIGRTEAAAGVGSQLTYVPGSIYLGGPYHGDPLSVIAITPAVAGPFDAGTVVVRQALDLDPKTAEVQADGSASDPIPHILQGIPLNVRDLRVYVDRERFILNPTSCDPSSAKATLFGSNLNVFDPADDVPVDLSTRYQAANCLNLGFEPRLGLKLKGGTRRGGHPGLRAHYRPKAGDANLKGLVVRLPRSAFLDQSHIRTICTRVQFAAKSCPKAAQYGYIRAWTPLLDEPLQGPVYLRSSNHKLPDLVFDLHGLVDVEVSTRIDSVRGGIRASVEDAPDAPISRVLLNMQGGKKGLIVNSRNLCVKAKRNRASVIGLGQNGKRFRSKPLMQVRCGRKAKRSSHVRARVARSGAVG